MDLPPPPAGAARLHALGDLRIFDSAGRSVTPLEAQPKRAALLIYLSCLPEGSSCLRDQLLALFWPDFDDERARNSLRTSLYYVRRAMGPGVLNSRPDGALEMDLHMLWCDVRAFDAAVRVGSWAEAAELYRGDFLQGGAPSVSVEFDQWVEATRRRLRRQCADALYRLAEKREQEGDTEGALEALGRARALLPADEAILRRVLLLWGRSGNRVRAVQEYEAFAETLRSLYELEPSEETLEILKRVATRPAPLPQRRPSASELEDGGAGEAAPAGPGAAVGAEPGPNVSTPVRAAGVTRHQGRRWPARPVGVGLTTVAMLSLGWGWSQRAVAKGDDTVAVLPFEVSGGGHLEPLAEALPALLSDELRQGGWQVLEARSLRELGPRWEVQVGKARELGASTVVAGQIVALGDTVSVLVATVPTVGAPVPWAWGRVTGAPADLAAITAALGRQLRQARR